MEFGTCHKVYSMWTVANGLWHFIRPTACVDCGACLQHVDRGTCCKVNSCGLCHMV